MPTTNLAIFPWTVSIVPAPQKFHHKHMLTAVALSQFRSSKGAMTGPFLLLLCQWMHLAPEVIFQCKDDAPQSVRNCCPIHKVPMG